MIVGRFRAAEGGFVEDGASLMGAALAYYTLFSLAPLLVLAIALIGVVYGEQRAKEELIRRGGKAHRLRQRRGGANAAGEFPG
jgi:membrane protein